MKDLFPYEGKTFLSAIGRIIFLKSDNLLKPNDKPDSICPFVTD